VDVLNIVIEPTTTGERFVVQAMKDNKGVLFGLDFSSIFNKTCDKIQGKNTKNNYFIVLMFLMLNV
jgi:hypothetical protein